jgi:neutral ceramidase
MKPSRVFAAAMAVASCAQLRMREVSEPMTGLRRREPGLLRVGTARVDVTPPPGPSTFGHGPDARVAEGYWSRLYCRVFVLETFPDNRVALVPCDLHSISTVLHREVAERVRAVVPTSHLFISATHTHAGPAHYFESAVYSGFSSSRRPGFDPEMVNFLATRIAAGIEAAHRASRPAALRWVRTSAWGLTRNRSMEAYNANLSPLPHAPPRELQLSAEETAVDPALEVLQIEAFDPQRTRLLGPMGWLVLFAMHPTVVSAHNRLFGGDVFGVTSRLLEAELRRMSLQRCQAVQTEGCGDLAGADPLVAMMNTNEGDIAPIWAVGSPEEAIRVGRALAERAWETHPGENGALESDSTHPAGPFRARVALDSRYFEETLPGTGFEAEDGTSLALCPEAELGAASGAGASDHPTSIGALFGSGSGVDSQRASCQAPKRRMLGSLQSLFLGASAFPARAPFSLLRIDDAWLSFVPAELTVQAGAAVNRRVLGAVQTEDGRPAHATVVGLSNSYFQYVTTSREYGVQAYEGASTLYGPASADYVAARLFLLAKSMMGSSLDREAKDVRIGQATAFTCDPPPQRARLPLPQDEAPIAQMQHRRVQRGLCTLPGPAPERICFWWTDGGPARVSLTAAPWLALVSAVPRSPVRICNAEKPFASSWRSLCDPGAAADDRGLGFQTRVRARDGDAWVWSTVMHLSSEEWSALGDRAGVRLRAAGSAGVPAVESDAFGPEAMPPRCKGEAVRFCLGDGEPEPRP